MKELFPLAGIVTVLNTPFDTKGNIDLPSLRKHVQYALRAGVAGFLVPALASEVATLSLSERLQMVATVTEEVAGKVPVFAGAGEQDIEKRKTIAKEYLAMGCRNILFQIPFETEDKFKSQFYELADYGVETIMLQDWSANGYGLPDDLILELFENVAAFRCLKVETVPAGVKYSRLLNITEGRLHLSGGWAVTQMIEGLRRGVHAFMPTGLHKTYCAIYQYFKTGELARAEELFRKLLPVLAFSNQHLDISIHFFKRLLYRQGIYSTPNVRASLLPFDAIHEEIADKLIERVVALEGEIKV
jgi:4-hydroxy-tetrahydrodipicolinate synthase